MISAHAERLCSACSATSGPRTKNEPSTANWKSAASTIVSHSHVRERTSCQPPARSAKNPRPSETATSPSGFTCVKSAPLTANVSASRPIAQPGSVTATSTPAIAGPTIVPTLSATNSSAFACWSRARLTVCGISPDEAGR